MLKAAASAVYRRVKAAPSGLVISSASISGISGTTITVIGTTSQSIASGVWGVEYTVGTVASLPSGYAFSVNTAGAASSQSIARPDASDGVISTSIVNVRAYYNLDTLDPPSSRVYANLVPFGIAGIAPTGTTTSGQTLTGVSGVMAGSDGMTLTYQWQRDGGTGTWVDINGATSATYVLTDTDVGSNIRRGEKATNSYGNSGFVNSASVGPVAAAGFPATNLVHAYYPNTGSVSSWPDAVGSAAFAQASSGNQPTIDGSGNRVFDGSNDFMLASLTLSQPFTLYMRLRVDTYAVSDRIWANNAISCSCAMLGSNPDIKCAFGGSVSVANDNFNIGNFVNVAFVGNGASGLFQVSGTSTTTVDGTNGFNGLILAAQDITPTNCGAVTFRSVGIYNVAHDQTTRNTVFATMT